jgi:uncharacterized protein YggL (DUF469 family)
MSKKLAGTLFVYNGNRFDYNFMESIQCLIEFCDKVFVVAGGEDGTYEMVQEKYGDKIILEYIEDEEWAAKKGKEKLNWFTNIAIEEAQARGYEYQFNLQADEIVHESSYGIIRKVIESNGEGFMCKRINLWKDCNHQLNVPQNRLPCSSEIIRLAKTKYRSCGDAESLDVPDVNQNYTNLIEIWHYGFVRKKSVMIDKIKNMQSNVFQIDYDKKLDSMNTFEWSAWFSENDLKRINKPHPKIMTEWVKTRP